MSTVFTNAKVLTLAGDAAPRRGAAHADLGIIDNGWVHVDNERIVACGDGPAPQAMTIDCAGQVLMPAFVDCHTHACWAGERFDEFEMKLAGASYLDILKSGGGIMSTVRAVRDADESVLVDLLERRLARMIAQGTAHVEIKSGYGLRTDAELKMLRAIHTVQARTPIRITATFLGAHAIDHDQDDFVERTIHETLPAAAEAFPGITCDAYCEDGAWSIDETRRLFEAAVALGCPLRVHTDQFNDLGMTALAIEMGAISVDHLEASGPQTIAAICASQTIGVALPASGFHLDDRYAPGRALIDGGAALAIATNYNPGSAPSPSMPFAIALASRKLGLRPAEAIIAATINAACVLRCQDDSGSIEAGKRADLQLLDCTDERELGYEFATAGPRLVMIGGSIASRRDASSQ